MNSFKNILVPIDFSTHSTDAVRAAADLSRKYEGAVTLLHVFQPISYALPEGYVLYTAAQMADLVTNIDHLLGLAKKDAESAGATKVKTQQVQGNVSAEIISYAQSNGIDLIVMGTHGRTGIAHAVLGSVAERVLRKAPCPVLTVRSNEPAAEE